MDGLNAGGNTDKPGVQTLQVIRYCTHPCRMIIMQSKLLCGEGDGGVGGTGEGEGEGEGEKDSGFRIFLAGMANHLEVNYIIKQ